MPATSPPSVLSGIFVGGRGWHLPKLPVYKIHYTKNLWVSFIFVFSSKKLCFVDASHWFIYLITKKGFMNINVYIMVFKRKKLETLKTHISAYKNGQKKGYQNTFKTSQNFSYKLQTCGLLANRGQYRMS